MKRELYFFDDIPVYLVRWSGELSIDDVIEHWNDLVKDSRWSPDLSALHDTRGVSLNRTYADAMTTGNVYESVGAAGNGKVAILVDTDVNYGVFRQLIAVMDMHDTACVTRSEAEAKQWVGAPWDLSL